MTDDIWQELLRSPLDEDPGNLDRAERSWSWLPAAAVLGGVVIGLAWLAFGSGDDGDVAASEPTSTTTVTVAAAESAESSLPDGYIEVALDGAPVRGSLGLRPESVYAQGDDLYVTLSSAVRAELEPERVAVFAGGDWSLAMDDAALPFSGEITNPQSLGLMTVRFDGAGGREGDDGRLHLRPVVESDSTEVTDAFTFNGLPARIDEPVVVELEEEVSLVVESIELGPDAGTLIWHLEAPPSVRARVEAAVEFPETIGREGGRTALVSEHRADPYPFQLPPKPRPTATWSGSEVLRRVGSDLEDPAALTRITVSLTVSWQRSSSSRVIEIPLEVGGS
jgi:hypothetical protein